ncbi:MAG TPA: BamA/TamA family outer membrane protein [Polyangia bacterium]|nr:BamA/TamA family outer membrane protein [Polyangia bacterium]
MSPDRPRLRAPLAALVLAAVALGAGTARAQAQRPLSRLERESVDEALKDRGLALEPNPAGKTIGTIYVVNQDVFSRRDWYFQLLNIFHRTTRENILRRELLFKPGQPYDQALIEETTRNLQTPASLVLATGQPVPQPELSSVVAIVPIVPLLAGRPGTVDVLVVTRDVWSLRLNTTFEFQQNTLSYLDTSLSENNLFGWRKYLSVGYTLDLGQYAVGPEYLDPNILGTRLQLYANATANYTRGTSHYEGNDELFALVYPLYALASRWGAGLSFAHEDLVQRQFLGDAVAPVPLLADPTTTLPDIYRRRAFIVDGNATRSWRSAVIQRLTLGYHFDDRRSLPLEGFDYGGATPAQIQELLAEYAPISEVRSEPYVGYSLFTPRYGIYRDLNTFDLRENRQLGPAVSLVAAYGSPELGADVRAFPLSGAASWTIGPDGSLASASLAGGLRLRDGQAIDKVLQAKLYFASPVMRRLLRVVASTEADAYRDDTLRRRYFLGGDSGLRGYAIGALQGPTQLLGHLELRTTALAITSQRVGALLFEDVGSAAATFSSAARGLLADVGVGLRWLIPQLNSTVIRFDWALPLVAVTLPNGAFAPAGLPGRLSVGFQQIF